jgi:hypothetical protein
MKQANAGAQHGALVPAGPLSFGKTRGKTMWDSAVTCQRFRTLFRAEGLPSTVHFLAANIYAMEINSADNGSVVPFRLFVMR